MSKEDTDRGEVSRVEKIARKSVVAISKGDDPEKMAAEIFELLGGRPSTS
jgi:hypothetical protein